VLWERILKKDYAMIFHHSKESLNSGAIMAKQFCEKSFSSDLLCVNLCGTGAIF
jgi:hypothetical protein